MTATVGEDTSFPTVSFQSDSHQQETLVLSKILLVNEDTGERRMLKSWYISYGGKWYSLGTPDRQLAEKRAYHFRCLFRAIFEKRDEEFTDDKSTPHADQK